jgi:peptidoglycan-associated lipoprotein
MRTITTIFVAATFSVACAKEQAPTHPSVEEQRPERPEDSPNKKSSSSTTSLIAIEQSIRTACGMTDSEAFFEYNSAQVTFDDSRVLQRLAACFSTGPLKGQTMDLVGHADPRGTDDYNMALGDRRAKSVKEVLGSLGLSRDVITTSSRGESDAQGTDLSSWSRDRRVDVTLGEPFGARSDESKSL